ncbi:MAG: response regulator transcription factor [Actinobacteria bacterium]|nr:response regulator transcription factor [Actinomycetota bacterium]
MLLVDDVEMMRTLARMVLETDVAAWTVVGEADDGSVAIDMAARLRPDVVVLDQEMPRVTGVEALPELRRLLPEGRIVMWSSDPTQRSAALAAGADDFVDKAEPIEHLVAALTA